MKQTPARIALAKLLDDHIYAVEGGELPVSGAGLVELFDSKEGHEVLGRYVNEYTSESARAAMADLSDRIQRAIRAFTEPVR